VFEQGGGKPIISLARFILSVALAATPLAPVCAQSAFSNEAVLPYFSTQNIRPALEAEGAIAIEDDVSENGNAYVRATFDDNRIIVATPRACGDDGQCRGLSLRAFWRTSPEMSEGELRTAIDQFNDNAVALGQLFNRDTVVLSFYLIGDYGLAQGNLRVSTLVFLNNLDSLRRATQ